VQADVPPEIAREIGGQAATLVRQSLAVAGESLRIKRLLDKANLPALFIKGSALAVLAFGKLGLRSSQDIDLLVSHEMLPEVTALILRAGYRRFDPPADISDAQLRLLMPLRKDLGFVHQASGQRIELHWRLFVNPHAMVDATIMTTSRIVPIAGTTGLRTLGEEDLFAYLCMHGALHWWYELKWLADVNAFLATSDSNIERLFRAGKGRGAGRAAAQALLLCRQIFGRSLPSSLLSMIGDDRTLRWLEATSLSAMTAARGESKPHDLRFGTTRGSLSTFLLSRSWRYRLAELKNHLITEADVLTVPLPERLWGLYPILRLPLWMWRHYRPSRGSS